MPVTMIGFGHKRMRGKDEAAKYVVETFNGLRKDEFAYSLKEGIGRHVFGLTNEQLYGSLKHVIDPFWEMTPREILQKAGTDAMRRAFGDSVWVKTIMRRLQLFKERPVISDVRFKSEANSIQYAGGVVIRIDRDIPLDPKIDKHESETDLDDWNRWDYVIGNSGTLEEFHEKVHKIVERVLAQ
jgi:hypothetical protein